MIDERQAMQKAREHLAAGVELELVDCPEPMYLLDRPENLFFFHVDPGHLRAGGDEVIVVRKRDGAVVAHELVGE